VKLLRAIQEGEVEPVGARKPQKVDVRLISATNRDLIADVKDGRFREDLFYRLHVFPITVPALAERPEDIPELARHFLARFAAEEGKRIRRLDNDAMTLLSGYRWPGNVRQLENAVFRAVVLADGDEVGVVDFPQIAALAQRQPMPTPPMPAFSMPAAAMTAPMMASPAVAPAPENAEAAALREISPQAGSIAPHQQPDGGLTLPLLDAQGEVRPMEELEAEVIRFAIAHYRGQMSEVARRLQIGRSTLYRKLVALGLQQRVAENDTDSVVSG
jgi:DNA-binding NtrC family response regulator